MNGRQGMGGNVSEINLARAKRLVRIYNSASDAADALCMSQTMVRKAVQAHGLEFDLRTSQTNESSQDYIQTERWHETEVKRDRRGRFDYE